MKLIYTTSGKEVQVGDVVKLDDDESVRVTYFRPPHKASSSGKVSVKSAQGWSQEFYVGVIGCEWIEREDRGETA